MINTPDGTCHVCGETYSNTGMTRHLKSCLGKPDRRPDGPEEGLLIRARGQWAPHWLYVLAAPSAELAALDRFLRSIWLECCGHLSEFKIDGSNYASDAGRGGGFQRRASSMNSSLGGLLGDGTEFEYKYDFGTSTPLSLKCYGRVPWPAEEQADHVPAVGGEAICCVARNERLELTCEVCDSRAHAVCAMCHGPLAGLVCEKHKDQHACGREMLLPVVNSPRMGVCGYTG